MSKVADTFSFLSALGLNFFACQMKTVREAISRVIFGLCCLESSLSESPLLIITAVLAVGTPIPGKGLKGPRISADSNPGNRLTHTAVQITHPVEPGVEVCW